VSCSLDLLGASIIRPGGVYETRGDSPWMRERSSGI